MSSQNRFDFSSDDDAVRDVAELIVRGNISVAKLTELSDTGNGGDVAADTKSDGYLRDSLYQTDGSAPLANMKHERVLEMYIDTGRREVAYRACVSGNCSKDSAIQQASRVLARVEVAARLKWLIADRKKAKDNPAAGGRMTREQKLGELEGIIRTGTPADRVRAIQEHNRLMAAGRVGAAGVPDPAFLAEFMRKAAEQGKDPVGLAKDIHGDEDTGFPGEPDFEATDDVPESDADVA